MSNQTTVRDVSIGGALAMLVIWLLSYYCPDLAASLPAGGEAGIALLISSTFAYFKEPRS
jgi:hypothetical protein